MRFFYRNVIWLTAARGSKEQFANMHTTSGGWRRLLLRARP
jgi:hypothetical protein